MSASDGVDLRPGYKQSEVGIIPDDWHVPYLRQQLLQDATYGVVKAGAFQRAGIPMLRGGDIKHGRVLDDQPLISHEKNTEYSRTVLRPNDVVIALVGYPGETAVVPQRLVGANVSRAVGLLRPAPGLAPAFLACYLNSPDGRKEFLRPSAGSAQIVVNLGALNKLRLPLPSHSEQRAIAEALGDVDALLDGLDRLIAKKHDLKQAAMQQLLTGETRLPGFGGGWEETTLGRIGECIIGLTYKPENVVEHGLLVLRSSNVQGGRLAFEDNVYVNVDVSDHLHTRPGDILVCVRNGSRALIGKCAVIDEAASGVTFGAFMSVFRTKHWRFVLHAFRSADIQRQIHDNIGATINQITNKDMRAFRVVLPPEAEQAAIAEVLDDMDAELAVLEARRDKTRLVKQAMMQELLTGKTRLVVAGSSNG